MKTNSLQKSNSPGFFSKLIYSKVFWVVLIFVSFSGLAFLFPSKIRSVFTNSAKPVWLLKNSSISLLSDFSGYFKTKGSLIKTNQDLVDRVATLELKEQDYNALLKENTDLKNLLERYDTVSNKIVSRVISKPPQSPYDTLVLDIGSTNGINIGSKVYISDMIIIGKVTSLTSRTALVTLFSNAGEKTSVELSRTGQAYEIEGQGGGNMRVTVPKETDIVWGDTFVYPAFSSPNVGSIYYIDTTSKSSFKTAFIRYPGNIFEAKWVFVEKSL
jgi:cell shape-determining protein MreC